MILGCAYAFTVVITFIEQSQLETKFRNKLYDDKYIETEKPRRKSWKETAVNTIKFLLPVYNVVSSIYNIENFDKYYEKRKDKLLSENYLEKVVIKEMIGEVNLDYQPTTISEEQADYIWGNDLNEEIEYVMPETVIPQKQKTLVKKYNR